MPEYLVLLRGVNVGGAHRLPMAELRAALEHAGFAAPRTYLASGNVVLHDRAARATAVADRVRDVVRGTFALDVAAVALTAAEWDTVVAGCPFDEPDPTRVHVLAFTAPLGDDDLAALDRLVRRSGERRSGDWAVPAGRIVYLHTPDGFGTSELARDLTARRAGALHQGTARNWRTVLALQALTSSRDG